MKRNITLAIDHQLLKRARGLAAQQGVSISRMLADQLRAMVAQDAVYRQAMTRALAHLEAPLHLGGAGVRNREALHDRAEDSGACQPQPGAGAPPRLRRLGPLGHYRNDRSAGF